MFFLKRATNNQYMPMGPFLDSVDGVTPETELDLSSNLAFNIWKQAQPNTLNPKHSGVARISAAAFMSSRWTRRIRAIVAHWMLCASPGRLLPVTKHCHVLPPRIYDSFLMGLQNIDSSGVLFYGIVNEVTSQTEFSIVTGSIDPPGASWAGTFEGQDVLIGEYPTNGSCTRRVVSSGSGSSFVIDVAPDFVLVPGCTIRVLPTRRDATITADLDPQDVRDAMCSIRRPVRPALIPLTRS